MQASAAYSTSVSAAGEPPRRWRAGPTPISASTTSLKWSRWRGHVTRTFSFAVGDVRTLPEIADASFDLAVFSYNGLDGLSHGERLLALAEIRRVLAPGGHFIFSAHNRLAPIDSPWIRRDLSWTRSNDFRKSLGTTAQGSLQSTFGFEVVRSGRPIMP